MVESKRGIGRIGSGGCTRLCVKEGGGGEKRGRGRKENETTDVISMCIADKGVPFITLGQDKQVRYLFVEDIGEGEVFKSISSGGKDFGGEGAEDSGDAGKHRCHRVVLIQMGGGRRVMGEEIRESR